MSKQIFSRIYILVHFLVDRSSGSKSSLKIVVLSNNKDAFEELTCGLPLESNILAF